MKKERISRVVSSEGRDVLMQAAVSSEQRYRRNSGGTQPAQRSATFLPATSRVKIQKVNGALVMRKSNLLNRVAKAPGPGKRGIGVVMLANPDPTPSSTSTSYSNNKLEKILQRNEKEQGLQKCQRAKWEEQITKAREMREKDKLESLTAIPYVPKNMEQNATASVSSPSVPIVPPNLKNFKKRDSCLNLTALTGNPGFNVNHIIQNSAAAVNGKRSSGTSQITMNGTNNSASLTNGNHISSGTKAAQGQTYTSSIQSQTPKTHSHQQPVVKQAKANENKIVYQNLNLLSTSNGPTPLNHPAEERLQFFQAAIPTAKSNDWDTAVKTKIVSAIPEGARFTLKAPFPIQLLPRSAQIFEPRVSNSLQGACEDFSRAPTPAPVVARGSGESKDSNYVSHNTVPSCFKSSQHFGLILPNMSGQLPGGSGESKDFSLSKASTRLQFLGERKDFRNFQAQNSAQLSEAENCEVIKETEAPGETNEETSPAPISINFYGSSEKPCSMPMTDVSSPDPQQISEPEPKLTRIYERGAKPFQLYFNRSGFVFGEPVKEKGVINFVKIGKKIKKPWKKSQLPLQVDSELPTSNPQSVLQTEGNTNPLPTVTAVLPSVDPLPGRYTVQQIEHVNYDLRPKTPQLNLALDFFLRHIVNGLSLTDLQTNFDIVIRKMEQFFTPLPSSEEVAEAMLWKLIATHDHPMVMEPIPEEIKEAGQDCRTEPPMPELYRKMMIAIGKLGEAVNDYVGLPGNMVAVFKKCFENERARMTESCLVSLGRFFGDLFDKYFPSLASPMKLMYFVMTKRPSATHAFFYGMLCSNPDPFTMLPMPFDYYAVSVRDRCILYAIFQSLQFHLRRYYEPTWLYMKSLGHTATELSWNEFANNLVHELADVNAEQRRECAFKGLKLIILQAGVTWFHTYFTKQWYELVKDFELKKYRMTRLMTDYITVVSCCCQEFLSNKEDFLLDEVVDATDKLVFIQNKIKDFLDKTPEIAAEMKKIKGKEEVREIYHSRMPNQRRKRTGSGEDALTPDHYMHMLRKRNPTGEDIAAAKAPALATSGPSFKPFQLKHKKKEKKKKKNKSNFNRPRPPRKSKPYRDLDYVEDENSDVTGVNTQREIEPYVFME